MQVGYGISLQRSWEQHPACGVSQLPPMLWLLAPIAGPPVCSQQQGGSIKRHPAAGMVELAQLPCLHRHRMFGSTLQQWGSSKGELLCAADRHATHRRGKQGRRASNTMRGQARRAAGLKMGEESGGGHMAQRGSAEKNWVGPRLSQKQQKARGS